MEMIQKSAHGGVAAPAFGLKSCNIVPLDGIVSQHQDEFAPRHIGRRYERGADADPATRHYRGDHRFAQVHDHSGRRYDFDFAFPDPKWPRKRLTSALIAQIDGFIPFQVSRVCRCAFGRQIGGRGESIQADRRQP